MSKQTTDVKYKQIAFMLHVNFSSSFSDKTSQGQALSGCQVRCSSDSVTIQIGGFAAAQSVAEHGFTNTCQWTTNVCNTFDTYWLFFVTVCFSAIRIIPEKIVMEGTGWNIFNPPPPQIEIGLTLPSPKLKYVANALIKIQLPFSQAEYCPAYPLSTH